MEQIKPDYDGGSIVNLMSTIARVYGKPSLYPPLRLLSPNELDTKNVLLIVIDGMGYEYLSKHGKGTLLWKSCLGSMTSVFPSTTSAAITTFQTGTAPLQHGITGWYMHLKELGMVTAVLPMRARLGGAPLNVDRKDIFNHEEFFTMRTHIVTHEHIAYQYLPRKGFKVHSYKNLRGFFSRTRVALRSPGKKFIYSYWPDLDTLLHEHGHTHATPREHLLAIDKALVAFLKQIRDTDTTVIITADHGLMMTAPSKVIDIDDHPVLADALALPICGEPRLAYCYVRPSKAKIFERYVKTRLNHVCEIHASDDFIKQGWFGKGKMHPRFHDRVGDYILVMKPGYIIRQQVSSRKPFSFHIGNHGGVSKEEMLVPLIIFKTGNSS